LVREISSLSALKPTIYPEVNYEGRPVEEAKPQVEDPEAIAEGVKTMRTMARIFERKLDFIIHEDTNRLMVKVIDLETEEVIREIPPEQILDMLAKMECFVGLLIDELV
jgi:flagellar protein FlaG